MVIQLMMAWLKVPRQSRMGAFTLVEAVITLSLICGILLIPGINYQRQLEIQQEKIALANFESNWNSTVKAAYLNHSLVIVQVNNSQHDILFRVFSQQIQSYHQHLPQSLACYSKKVLIKIKPNSVQPQTIRFYSKLTGNNYYYRIQMKWGRLLVQKS
ncbi:hypothetical protein HU830_08175 [Lactobacillus sp. DCY120]|uniref:Uncharacterized protein n=1 Tax=Bombilactobacillus apium TaxID=2675299 RepID=A0A850RCT0_9LACO|nr:hypothetical protein [Bombilactobacillus apium]NVY97096.1 hypothetical protein [Bombilactobacillus apium]